MMEVLGSGVVGSTPTASTNFISKLGRLSSGRPLCSRRNSHVKKDRNSSRKLGGDCAADEKASDSRSNLVTDTVKRILSKSYLIKLIKLIKL
jgi:hypothetical protein